MRPNNSCARACAPTRTVTRFCWNWGASILITERNPRVARNIFILARQRWRKQDAAGDKPDPHAYEEILGEIVRTDRAQDDSKAQLADLEALIKVARGKETLQRQIDELKIKNGRTKAIVPWPLRFPLPFLCALCSAFGRHGSGCPYTLRRISFHPSFPSFASV